MSANGESKLKRVKLSLSFPTNNETSIQNVFCAVKSKRKYKKKPQADSELRKISFFVEVKNQQQYFDHLQLRKVLLKLLPFQTSLLLFQKQNSKGIRKIHIIFLTKIDPNKCSIRVMFERAQKEVLDDGMKIYYKYINFYSSFTYVKTMKRCLVTYECIRLKNASDTAKKRLCEISQFLACFCANSKNALMHNLNDHSLFSEK